MHTRGANAANKHMCAHCLVEVFDIPMVLIAIGRIEWRDRGRWRMIEAWDRHGESRMRLFVVDEWLAKRFIDAIGVLVEARLEADENVLYPMRVPAH